MLSKDAIKEILFDDLGFTSREEKVKLGVAAMHILYYAAARMMKAGNPFILENNFEDSSVEGITVRLTGDPVILYQRFAARDLSDTRHRGHVVNDCYPEPAGAVRENPTRKTYEQYLQDIENRGYNRFIANGPLIELDVTDFQKLDFDKICRDLTQIINSMERIP